jgi:hypothetical protein
MTIGQRANEDLIRMKNKQLATKEPNPALALERVLIQGDLSPLNVDERLDYVKRVARAIGINPMLRPFDYITFNGKTVLYANRACAEQLRMKYKISIEIASREKTADLYIVIARAITGSGRKDEAMGAISIRGLQGEALANALLKCETKAKRRVTLSVCGLGLMDEIEARDIAEREVKQADKDQAEVIQGAIAETINRPEFETTPQETSISQEAPAAVPEYTLKAGKYAGKKISQLTEKQLKRWLAFYDEQVATGAAIHPDITLDYTEIIHFTDQKKLEQAEMS